MKMILFLIITHIFVLKILYVVPHRNYSVCGSVRVSEAGRHLVASPMEECNMHIGRYHDLSVGVMVKVVAYKSNLCMLRSVDIILKRSEPTSNRDMKGACWTSVDSSLRLSSRSPLRFSE
jgi:hypothetical protein